MNQSTINLNENNLLNSPQKDMYDFISTSSSGGGGGTGGTL